MRWYVKTTLFNDWVRKWKVGPGMNDVPRAIESLEHEITQPLTSWRTAERVEDMRQTLELLKEGLYSGYDGKVGDGWIPILDRLAHDLKQMGWDGHVHQIKEKFGTLRFYIGHGTEEMFQRIARAEDETADTCENCGARASENPPHTHYWIKTLCSRCHEERHRASPD